MLKNQSKESGPQASHNIIFALQGSVQFEDGLRHTDLTMLNLHVVASFKSDFRIQGTADKADWILDIIMWLRKVADLTANWLSWVCFAICRLLVMLFWFLMPDGRYFGCWWYYFDSWFLMDDVLVVGCWLLVVGCWLLVMLYWFLMGWCWNVSHMISHDLGALLCILRSSLPFSNTLHNITYNTINITLSYFNSWWCFELCCWVRRQGHPTESCAIWFP